MKACLPLISLPLGNSIAPMNILYHKVEKEFAVTKDGYRLLLSVNVEKGVFKKKGEIAQPLEELVKQYTKTKGSFYGTSL